MCFVICVTGLFLLTKSIMLLKIDARTLQNKFVFVEIQKVLYFVCMDAKRILTQQVLLQPNNYTARHFKIYHQIILSQSKKQ